MTKLTTNAIDESTYKLEVTCTDSAGSTVVPGSGTWTMTNEDGDVVNSREDVELSVATTMTIVLSGDDIAFADGRKRVITFSITYSSDEGSNLPLREEVWFEITNLVKIT